MRRLNGSAIFLATLCVLLMAAACSKPAPENPFAYPFIRELHLNRRPGKPFSDYKAFYLLTEDYEPRVESASDIDSIREVLKFASGLSSKYRVHWTHFVDANTLSPAFISGDQELKLRCSAMIADLKAMAEDGDDCELHLHGPLNRDIVEQLRSEERLHLRGSGTEAHEPYRQRRSFFFESFYRTGYREMVASLTYGKRLLEKSLYDGKRQVLAFRPGGWDHGSSDQDTLLYFHALSGSGLTANSGLSTGNFGGENWRVGNDPGHNVAIVQVGEEKLFEVSPTAGPGGYINPVLPHDLRKLANSVKGEMAVIVAVYHLGALQMKRDSRDAAERTDPKLQEERAALEQHFKTVADLSAAKVLYPITLRELLEIIAEQQ